MKKFILLAVAILGANVLSAQNWKPESTEWYYPVPADVKPGKTIGQPPSDAIVLFDGKDLSQWVSSKGGEAKWEVSNGEMVIVPGSGDIATKGYYGDCQLHIEFKCPAPDKQHGNSGIFLQSTYELQVWDGGTPLYVNGQVGSMYKQSAPLAMAYTKHSEWQVFDIFWVAPKFGPGEVLEEPARITVTLNGIVVQNNYIVKGTTPYIGLPEYKAHGRLPLLLQDHGSAVAYRNIWIRNL
jgi:hypothetical protein